MGKTTLPAHWVQVFINVMPGPNRKAQNPLAQSSGPIRVLSTFLGKKNPKDGSKNYEVAIH